MRVLNENIVRILLVLSAFSLGVFVGKYNLEACTPIETPSGADEQQVLLSTIIDGSDSVGVGGEDCVAETREGLKGEVVANSQKGETSEVEVGYKDSGVQTVESSRNSRIKESTPTLNFTGTDDARTGVNATSQDVDGARSGGGGDGVGGAEKEGSSVRSTTCDSEVGSEYVRQKYNSTCFFDPAAEGKPVIGCLPNFLLFGFPKCATSSIFRAISQNPRMLQPRTKETMWFALSLHPESAHLDPRLYALDFPDLASGQDWATEPAKTYKDRLRTDGNDFKRWQRVDVQTDHLTGEATGNFAYTMDYHLDKTPLSFLPEWVPNAKLICVLRNPAQRAWSSYKMFKKFKTYPELDIGFTATIKADMQKLKPCAMLSNQTLNARGTFLGIQAGHPNCAPSHVATYGKHPNFVYQGVYADHLLPWLQRYPRENFLFLTMSEWSAKPLKVMRKIEKFLNLQPFNYTGLDITFNADACVGSNNGGWVCKRTGDEMDAEAEKLLTDFYKPHNKRVKNLLGIDLDNEPM